MTLVACSLLSGFNSFDYENFLLIISLFYFSSRDVSSVFSHGFEDSITQVRCNRQMSFQHGVSMVQKLRVSYKNSCVNSKVVFIFALTIYIKVSTSAKSDPLQFIETYDIVYNIFTGVTEYHL